MPHPTPDLPTLHPNDQRLLQSYFTARCDIFILAQKENLAVLDLIRWSQLPAVQSHLAALKSLTDHSLHLRTAQARLLSLDTLEKIVKTTEDPIELRRAASTLFRGGASMPQPRAPKKPDPDNPPPRYISPEHRRNWGHLAESVIPAYKPPRPTPHDSYVPPTSVPPKSVSSSKGASPSRIRAARTPLPPAAAHGGPRPMRSHASRSDRPEGARTLPGAQRGSASQPLESLPNSPRPGGPTKQQGNRRSPRSRLSKSRAPP